MLLGDPFFNHNLIVYFCYLILPLIVSFILFNTRHGMNLRWIGENASAADASGIQVKAIRNPLCHFGGRVGCFRRRFCSFGALPTWQAGIINGRGWIALALVIFARWKPSRIVWGALLFGGVLSFGYVAQARNWGINAFLLSMLPYLSTLVIMIIPIALMPKANRR